MTTWRHQMPFGAELGNDGSVRFRLWAPGAERVDLIIDTKGREHVLPMQPAGDGWREHVGTEAAPGSLYSYRIDGGLCVPDPASRFQPRDVHGPSQVVDPEDFAWSDDTWTGRPWEEAVFYELHVGTFSPEGSFRGVADRLDYLADLGVTAIELMPIADFPGKRNWGYDGVLPFAPDASYGTPRALKSLVQAAHRRGLMVFLDVVYNHFGPEGNYLHLYAPQFFTDRHQTPWGAGLNFDDAGKAAVRAFFIHNALYWLTEYRFDGLRLDAVHAIADDSEPNILVELAEAVKAGPGRERSVHLVLENDDNAARYLTRRSGKPVWYAAQWNDDFHHAAHVLATGERDGYYADYAEHPVRQLGRCLAEGFAYQGDVSAFRDGAVRGEPSTALPPTAFVNLLQNHDQVGNRAFGERICTLASEQSLRALSAVLLLAPSPPLLFMGQERMSETPFLFFCDFGDELAQAVTEGRRREFARFERFSDPRVRAEIPDPNAPESFECSRLDWDALGDRERRWVRFHRELLDLRRREIAPRLRGAHRVEPGFEVLQGPDGNEQGLMVRWRLGDGADLTLLANLGEAPLAVGHRAHDITDAPLFLDPVGAGILLADGEMPGWCVAWHLKTPAHTAAPRHRDAGARSASRGMRR